MKFYGCKYLILHKRNHHGPCKRFESSTSHPHSGRSLTPLTWPSCCDVKSSLRSRKNPGTVDPECDVTEICKETAEEVRRICRYYQMPVPNIGVETHDVTTEEHADLKFAFIPGIINYIVQEILKNSCRATLELYSTDLDRHPIQIIICGTTSIGFLFFEATRPTQGNIYGNS